MHPDIEALFDDAESRYLKIEELGILNQYVDSLPERLETYRQLRNREVEIMQPVADELEAALPNVSQDNLERSLKNAILLLRYCAMAMLLNDEAFVRNRLLNWVEKAAQAYNTRPIDSILYPLLERKLGQILTPQQMGFLSPPLTLAKNALLDPASVS
ncbi:MAG: hypothetical protein EA367_07135 [Leptolyngbya sp. DLM2.Bin15]|nr:MAG: hypothetical protein EA367_07135 [Leptolyngbya sp. DLM2.Bin15]